MDGPLVWEAESPAKSHHASIGAEGGQFREGEIAAEAWIFFSRHAFERFERLVCIAQTGMDKYERGRKIFASCGHRFSLCAPPGCGIGIATVVVGSAVQLFVSPNGFSSLAVLEKGPRELLSGVIQAIVGGWR